ncbi:autotransporter domain-containing protein [Achromobacter seleniivolatilans]|uniref:Autotransporter domain-containing protein n=1 Tax=Achromobacter seleniivolatilans TaxID=3047478 RepID=A0ABY9LW01_9BURK|nr:autotransporter domain-containing protein [Achromobacter sp. R39]WMD18966.1 autotransporter domain-containing protein [Achromobacter sp. R39]
MPVVSNGAAQAGILFVGGGGSGVRPSLTVKDGGQLTSGAALIGNSNNGSIPGTSELESGSAKITGVGSQWTADSFTLGLFGTGTMTVELGGKGVTATTTTLGASADATGSLTVTGLNSSWQSGQLTVGSAGTGFLTVSNKAQVNSASLLMSFAANSTGTADITGAGSSLQTTGNVTVGSGGTATLNITNGGKVTSGGRTYAGLQNGSVGTVNISGAGSMLSSLVDAFNVGARAGSQGQLQVNAGGGVDAYQIIAGLESASRGAITADGAATRLMSTGAFIVGYQGAGTATMSNGATISTVNRVRIADQVGSTGTLNIGSAAGDAAVAPGLVQAALGVRFGNGTGKLVFNHTSNNYVFDAGINSLVAQAGVIDVLAGTTVLSGDSSGFSGTTNVHGGALSVNGILGGQVAVGPNATLNGSGTVAQNVVLTGGVLQGTQGQTLKIGGNLTLDSASQVNVALGAASSQLLFDVGGNLALAGKLNVSDQGAFGAGVYRLFDYGGVLTGSGLTVGAMPAGVSAGALTVQTVVPGQVNLVSTAATGLGFWNGGNGTWSAAGSNWTNADGTVRGVYQPNPTFAVFQAPAGTVTVDASAGAIGVTGMQFAADGYRVQGDAIALQGAGGETIIRVGTGSAASAGMTGTIASSLTGNSKLAKTDYGTLVLAGDNTYTGGTDIRSGTLSVSKDTNLGAATGGVTLDGGVLAATGSFDTARSILVAQSSGIDVAAGTAFGLTGAIAGSQGLTKTGAGTLTVAGDGSAYTGHTQVQSGVLNIASTGQLGGTLAIASGAWLQGAGRVGPTTLQSGAVLAPGNRNETLGVSGNLTLLPGSVYQVAADRQSQTSTRVDVSGTANLAGSVVRIAPDTGYDSGRQYTILTAGAINGKFDSVSSNYAYLNPALSYGAQNVTLQLNRKQVTGSDGATRPITFADVAQSTNQRAVASALESLPAGNALHNYILTLPEGATTAVFNSLSGEAHASATSSLTGFNNTIRTVPLSYLRTNLGAGLRAGSPTAQAGGTLSAAALPSSNAQPAWAEVIGNWQTWKGGANSAQVRQQTGGVFAGVDHAVGGGWRLGGAVGFTDGNIRVDDRSSKADVASYSAALYGGKTFDIGAGKLNLMVGASYTWHDMNTERYASVSGGAQKLTADYGASTTQLFSELGYLVPLSERVGIEPFVGLSWADTRTRGFSESGGYAALRGHSGSDKQTSSTLGLRTRTDFTIGRTEARVLATLGWRHAFGDVLPQSTMSFDGGQAFSVAGAPIARNAALAELGVEMAITRNASIGLNYSGQFGEGNRENAGSINMTWRY